MLDLLHPLDGVFDMVGHLVLYLLGPWRPGYRVMTLASLMVNAGSSSLPMSLKGPRVHRQP